MLIFQMNRCRIEADDTMVRLEETVKESELIQQDGEFELEKARDLFINIQ